MRVSVLTIRSSILLRGAALGLIAGFTTGCSSDFARFAPTSNDYTGSINQQQIIYKQAAPAAQAFPDQVPVATAAPYEDSLNGAPLYTSSVQSDGTIRPVVANAKSAVKRTVLAPVAAAGTAVVASKVAKATAPISAARSAVTQQAFPAEIAAAKVVEPVAKATAKAKKFVDPVDQTVTGTVAKAKAVVAAPQEKIAKVAEAAPIEAVKTVAKTIKPQKSGEGWSAVGGTSIAVRQGETVYNLAKRYGVPANAILEANGLNSASDLQSGQRVVIPNYIYSNTAKISAPDADEDVKIAKSSRGSVTDVAEDKVPLPKQAPAHENVAVLPTVPQVRTKQAPEAAVASKIDQPGLKVLSKKAQAPVEEAKLEPKPVKVAAKTVKGVYAVASGDSLYTIAKRNGTSVEALKAANGIADGKLKIGQELKIPAAGAVVASVKPAAVVDPIKTGTAAAPVKKAAVVAKVVEAPAPAKALDKTQTAAIKPTESAPSSAVIEEAEKDTVAAPNATGISKLRWPVRGRTLVGYGQADAGKANDGIDISVPNGTPVKSAENGVVIYAGTGLKDFGNTVLVRHDNGLVTVYGHNGDISVKRGQTVRRGQELAKSGMSGNTKVPKLHFEVRKNSKPINPATELE